MNLSHVVDVVIGLSFTFFLLALIASGVQEVIAGMFAWRGTYLAKAIDVLIDNDPQAHFSWSGLWGWLGAHFTPGPAPSAAEKFAGEARDNSKLLDITRTLNKHPLLRNAPDALPSYVPSSNFSLALLEVLRDGSALPLFSQIERTVAALPAGDLKTTLAAFVQDAAGDIDKFRAHIEHWFDAAMARVSGIYKRNSQYVLLVLGAIFAIVLNADALQLAHTLWYEPSASAILVANARSANPGISASEAWTKLQGLPIPIGWTKWGVPTLFQVGGWIVSALAISLGAPFWFDLFRKLGNPRAGGSAP